MSSPNMKINESVKLFKRKTMSVKLLQCDQKINNHFSSNDQTTKYLSPKNITGLDTVIYKKQQSLVKTLQHQVNRLRSQVNKLSQQNISLNEQNKILRNDIQQHSETQRNHINQQYATVNVLNELKEKIQLLNQDDQLSTFDDIDMQDICHCQQYQKQLKQMKCKVKFLQQSLLHSQQIIMKLQQEIKKVKSQQIDNSNKIKQQIKAHIKQMRNKQVDKSVKSRQKKDKRDKYKISSIQQIVEDNQQ